MSRISTTPKFVSKFFPPKYVKATQWEFKKNDDEQLAMYMAKIISTLNTMHKN